MSGGRKTRRRIYLLNGREIDSGDVCVTLHKALKDKHDSCAICLKKVKADQEYLKMNTPFGYIFHKVCYFKDHLYYPQPSIIVGVGTRTHYPYGKRMGIKNTQVICKKFTVEDLRRVSIGNEGDLR